ncbi:AAA family ATPase [Psychrobacillus psychrodurans]|uniref:ATP-binding protein n=1 Tax=Psychrobacillus psychrodurans TaxID=126157 RepID=A0A9X3LBA1_9BACI|nr:AAA family ATPase [Psychrobacillus psychrodurans]MCZ8533034.1 ATP-binding protein [Psychrobacillus psychrodurans]
MDRIRIQNLRALKDTDYIELKPLTILVGKNSSGKSTFLRFFSLMKQTLETRTNEPILWYSPSYVDFGSFEESLNHESKEKLITFEFDFFVSKENFYDEVYFNLMPRRYNRAHILKMTNSEKNEKVKLELSITFSKKKINKIEVKLWEQKIEYLIQGTINEMEKVEILINGNPIGDSRFISRYFGDSTNMLPRIFNLEEDKIMPIEAYFHSQLFNLIKGFAPSTTKESTIDDVITLIKFGDSETVLKSINEIKSTSKTLEKRLGALKLEQSEFIEVKNNHYGTVLNVLLEICNRELKSFFSSVKYIAPIRASAERYYRIQGLALDEIDPQGANIPMLLNNMSNKDKRSFNKWIKENFHFEIIADSERGHASLYIRYENGTQINLADTGFGYSQILPIILVMWQAVQKGEEMAAMPNYKKMRLHINGRRKINFTIVIEQPELHLHPSLQGTLIDTFAKIIKVSEDIGIDLKIIIETHSETMINRIGQLIATNFEEFNEKLVNVLIFNSSHPYISKIESTGYTEDGYLNSWPIGFFSPEEI